MPSLKNEDLKQVLVRDLKLREAVFHLERWKNRISGSVISPDFRGQGSAQRQRSIWDALERNFGAESTHYVGMLLAFTPEEWDIKLEGQHNGHGQRRVRPSK